MAQFIDHAVCYFCFSFFFVIYLTADGHNNCQLSIVNCKLFHAFGFYHGIEYSHTFWRYDLC